MPTTITRASWTDDDGTGTTGTVISNTRLQNDIYAKIDELFAGSGSYTSFDLGGDLTVADQAIVGSTSLSNTAKFAVQGNLPAPTGASAAAVTISPNLTEAGSGTHALLEIGRAHV